MDKEKRSAILERFERATELPLLLLALAMIPLLGVPLLIKLDASADRILITVDWIIWGVFALELSIRTYLSERRLQYLARNWFDVLIVALPILRPLRVLRSARSLRMLRLVRLAPFAARITTAVRAILRRGGLQYVLAFGVVSIFASAGAVFLVERSNGGTVDDYGTALWWAVTTATTVGYGDSVPETPAGRGIAVFLMLVGISFFSWMTASIAAFLVDFGRSGGRAVTMADLMEKLEGLEREVRLLKDSKSPGHRS